MYTCNIQNCGSTSDIWEISNDNKTPPYYQKFHVCNSDLHLMERFKDIHAALVRGRYDNESTNRVSHNDWNFSKVVTTWKHKDRYPLQCFTCNTTDKIWVVVKPLPLEEDEEQEDEYCEFETINFCDNHLPRIERSQNLKIQSYNDDVGCSTIEQTWTEEQKMDVSDDGKSSAKKTLLLRNDSNLAPIKKKKVKDRK